ncbi:MAG: hypothetical protein HAW67_03375 [Endozoicomonadaceae bacterium]|nr:hypothetical protein [Endozoicomonadaceae bacterium]
MRLFIFIIRMLAGFIAGGDPKEQIQMQTNSLLIQLQNTGQNMTVKINDISKAIEQYQNNIPVHNKLLAINESGLGISMMMLDISNKIKNQQMGTFKQIRAAKEVVANAKQWVATVEKIVKVGE